MISTIQRSNRYLARLKLSSGIWRIGISRWLLLVSLIKSIRVVSTYNLLGGTIGTGLFIGSGAALAKSGPVGTLIGYMFVGTVVFSVMISLGEMATYIPVAVCSALCISQFSHWRIQGAFTVFATRFVSPTLGFAMGWIYWFSWAITYALELTASGLIIQYWNKSLSIGIWIGVFWTVSSCSPLRLRKY